MGRVSFTPFSECDSHPARAAVLTAVIVLLTGCARGSSGVSAGETRVRQPKVAGAFYPSDPDDLRSKVEGYLEKAAPEVPASLKGRRPIALVVPHAGYPYSGQTAAYAYSLLQGAARPSRVIVLGPSHRVDVGSNIVAPPYTDFRTPLGKVPIDTEARDRLAKTDLCTLVADAHAALAHRYEHSLEVQLPFLQVLWKEPPPVLPVVVGRLKGNDCAAAAVALRRVIDDDTLLVVSSDFTHYGPRYGFRPFRDATGGELSDRIRELDMGAVKYMKQGDPSGFRQYVEETGATICGADPIALVLQTLSSGTRPRGRVLYYTTSGEVTGDYTNSVSYVAYAMWAGQGESGNNPERQDGATQEADRRQRRHSAASDGGCTPQQQEVLLEIARKAIRRRLEGSESLEVSLEEYGEILQRESGVFVTLKRDGRLRGCIGYVTAAKPLARAVADAAVRAALRDRRFTPVQKEELPKLRIQISVLSPLQQVQDPSKIQVGRDGLIVARGQHVGLLVPQVATEQGWDREEFLAQTCRKAGLPADAWKDARIYRFTAEVFGEPSADYPEE